MDQTPPPTEAQLLTAYREATGQAKREAADRLFASYYERVGRWCFRFTRDRDSAADLAQEVFLKAHRHLDSFRGDSQFGTWLYSIVRNEAFNRARRDPLPSEPEETLLQLPSQEPSPEKIAELESSSRRLHQLLQSTLDETEHTVFVLHYGDGLPLEGITKMLRLENSSGAKAYIVSAKRKLARAVEKWFARGERL